MNFRRKGIYLILLVPSLFAASVVWILCIAGALYHCWDDVPILTFIPPFVHDAVILNTGEHDYYIVPAWLVYALWIGFMVAALGLPLIIIRYLSGALCVRHVWRI